MIETEGRTIGDVFAEAVDRYGNNPFIMVPPKPGRSYHPQGAIITYAEAGRAVERYVDMLRDGGYGPGHRLALLLENRPEMLLLKIACHVAGVSWVPVNPDYRPSEIAYLLQDSDAELAVCVPEREVQMRAGIAESGRSLALDLITPDLGALTPAKRSKSYEAIEPLSESGLIYTSGTTGQPKGCIMSHAYELELGRWYNTRGGIAKVREGQERLYNALPLFHINAGLVSFFAMLLSGNAQVQPERFSRTRWWHDVRWAETTIIHYLGVIIPVLMNEPPSERDREHSVRFGFGAGVEPTLHRAFEERFGIPLAEGWGMTETCRILVDCHEPRMVDTRAMGRPQPDLEIRVVDENDADVPVGEPGEMVVRYSAETPRKHAFLGYLNLPEETEKAWRGGWFHTGDTVRQDETGMLFFVDRKKNIIRRSGENIAAAEIEACLQAHPNVAQVAVLAVDDALRDEEVMACIVARDAPADEALARVLFDEAFEKLAYYKAPGWVLFRDELPVTGTQKIQKHMLFADGEDPTSGAHDFRELKRRSQSTLNALMSPRATS